MLKLSSGIIFVLFSLWIQPAMAYIDPGSGSAIMSVIIGFFVAIGITVRTYWYKIKSFFTGRNGQDDSDKDLLSKK